MEIINAEVFTKMKNYCEAEQIRASGSPQAGLKEPQVWLKMLDYLTKLNNEYPRINTQDFLKISE